MNTVLRNQIGECLDIADEIWPDLDTNDIKFRICKKLKGEAEYVPEDNAICLKDDSRILRNEAPTKLFKPVVLHELTHAASYLSNYRPYHVGGGFAFESHVSDSWLEAVATASNHFGFDETVESLRRWLENDLIALERLSTFAPGIDIRTNGVAELCLESEYYWSTP